MMKKILMLGTLTAVTLFGCGEEKASFTTQEDARRQALENAEYNVRSWRDTNAPETKILMRGDSTISAECIQGDGWATVDLISPETRDVLYELKCSTVSGTIGCLSKKDFQSRSFAKEDGRCNRDLPIPFPKIVK